MLQGVRYRWTAGNRLPVLVEHEFNKTAILVLQVKMEAEKYFWKVFFIPVIVVSNGIMLALLTVKPDLDRALLVVVAVKAIYFLIFSGAVLLLKKLWILPISTGQARLAWVYRLAGLLGVVSLLILYGDRTYQYGQVERKVIREEASVNASLPETTKTGITLEHVRLAGRNVIYEMRLSNISIDQVNKTQFKAAVQQKLKQMICRNAELTELLADNIGFRYIYRDRNDDILTDEIFRKNACQGMG